MDDLKNIKEEIPILTGPGAVFIALVIIALFLTSPLTRKLLMNVEFAGALVLFSIPLSVLFVQVYHGYAILIEASNRDLGKPYQCYKKHKYRIITMMDYLAWENDKKLLNQWAFLYRRAKGKNLFGSLIITCFCFTFFYSILCIFFPSHLTGNYSHFELGGWSCIIVIGIGLWLTVYFYFAYAEIVTVMGILDKKLLESINYPLNEWIENEIEHIND